MASSPSEEPSIDSDKLSYEIFSILESKFLFGYDHHKLWLPTTTATATATATPTPLNPSLRGKICILTIDSGGMRGILSGKALAYLDHALKAKSGDPHATIAHYFDVAAGTGVGGIFAAMLFATKDHTRPIFNADDTWNFLSRHGKRFYPSSSKFLPRFLKPSGTAALEKAMKQAFSDLTLKDTLKPLLIPCYDLSNTTPSLFSRADALEADSYDFKLSEVCRATSAEPGVFQPVQMRSADGNTQCVAAAAGIAMSNPTAAAITHVLHNKQEFPFVRGVEDLLVLSLGTGQLLEFSFPYEQVKKWKAKHWARPVARISGDSSADLVDHSVAMAFGQCRRSSDYVRIQATGSSLGRLGPNVDTDASPSNVKMLIGIAEEMLKQKNVESVLFGGKQIAEQSNLEKLDWFAGELVQEHQRRSSRIAPTVAFKQARPRTT